MASPTAPAKPPFIPQAYVSAMTNVIAHKTVAAAGTSVQLSTTTVPIQSIVVKALSANTGLIYVWNATGNGSTNGFELNAKEAVTLVISDLSSVWIDAAVNGEGVCYIAS